MAAASDPRGYYGALGLDRTASAEDIKAAFRYRAKLLHPDQSGEGGDEEGFRRLVEAYEALRDPQQRVRYDAESLAHERWRDGPDPAPRTDEREPDRSDPDFLRRLRAWLEARSGRHDRWHLGLSALVLVLLALLAVTLGRVADRDRELGELRRQHEAAPAAAAASAPRPEDGPLPRIYRSELRFPARSAELDEATQARLDAIAKELQRAIGGLPQDGRWVLQVEAAIDRAADRGGLLVDAWERALLRAGASAQYLIAHGIAAERLAVRFDAGPLAATARTDTVVFELLCCAPPPGG